MSDRVAAVIHAVLAGLVVVATVAWQAELIDGWLAVFVAVAGTAASVQVLRNVERKYRPYVFEPLGSEDVPANVRRHFERHTPALMQLGFQRVGDFRLLPPPIPEVARVFISGEGRCFAAVAQHAEINYVAFTSMTADGTYFESATLESSGDGPSASVPLRFQYLGAVPLAVAYARHQRFVGEHEAAHGDEAVVCRPEDFRHVLEYGHRLAGWDLFHKGRRKTAPPPLPDVFSHQPLAASPE
jgi:hypothetical protein